jgi:hypothetical protein
VSTCFQAVSPFIPTSTFPLMVVVELSADNETCDSSLELKLFSV